MKETTALASLQKHLQDLGQQAGGDTIEIKGERRAVPADLNLSVFDKLFGRETKEQAQLKARSPFR